MQIQYILLESASEENIFELFQDSDITDLAVDSPSGLVNISCIIQWMISSEQCVIYKHLHVHI